MLRRADEALPYLQEMATLMPGHPNALGYAAACYAAVDRTDEAGATIAKLRQLSPHYTLD